MLGTINEVSIKLLINRLKTLERNTSYYITKRPKHFKLSLNDKIKNGYLYAIIGDKNNRIIASAGEIKDIIKELKYNGISDDLIIKEIYIYKDKSIHKLGDIKWKQ
jgi:hypothetical protein